MTGFIQSVNVRAASVSNTGRCSCVRQASSQGVPACGSGKWYPGTIEAGVHLMRSAWLLRLGEEALRAALAHGFDTLGLPMIVAGHGIGHDNSRPPPDDPMQIDPEAEATGEDDEDEDEGEGAEDESEDAKMRKRIRSAFMGRIVPFEGINLRGAEAFPVMTRVGPQGDLRSMPRARSDVVYGTLTKSILADIWQDATALQMLCVLAELWLESSYVPPESDRAPDPNDLALHFSSFAAWDQDRRRRASELDSRMKRIWDRVVDLRRTISIIERGQTEAARMLAGMRIELAETLAAHDLTREERKTTRTIWATSVEAERRRAMGRTYLAIGTQFDFGIGRESNAHLGDMLGLRRRVVEGLFHPDKVLAHIEFYGDHLQLREVVRRRPRPRSHGQIDAQGPLQGDRPDLHDGQARQARLQADHRSGVYRMSPTLFPPPPPPDHHHGTSFGLQPPAAPVTNHAHHPENQP